MNRQIFKISVVISIAAILSGCATSLNPQQDPPKSAVQSNTGSTVSGYIDVGAGKSFR
jgi:hypothetical protein